MFTINRPQRQAVATVALLLFTVLPTGYVAWTAWWINRPAHRQEIENELGRRLGVRVKVASVKHPKPGEDVLRHVVCRQEEPRGKAGRELAQADVVRIGRDGRDLTLTIDELKLAGDSPRQAMDQVSALLQRAGGDTVGRISLSARECVLALGSDSRLKYRFRDLIAISEAKAAAPTIRVSYRVPEEGFSTRCEATLVRDRRADPVRTTLTFKSMEGLPLPARVLEPFFDTAEWLGRSAHVEGSLSLSQEGGNDWEAQFQGTLHDVDLSALVGRRFPDHRLTGLARIKLSRAVWAQRPGGQGLGWVEVEGELTSGPGLVSSGLVQALKTEMKFRLPARLEGRRADLPFQNLGLTFQMMPDGELKLDGGLGSAYPPGAVIVDANHVAPLAYAPEGAANVRGLIRTLFPTSGADPAALVPDTAESRVLHYLPAPVTASKRVEIMSN